VFLLEINSKNSKPIQEIYAKFGSSFGKLEEYSRNSKSIQDKSINK
jgi:hypothetical protein